MDATVVFASLPGLLADGGIPQLTHIVVDLSPDPPGAVWRELFVILGGGWQEDRSDTQNGH